MCFFWLENLDLKIFESALIFSKIHSVSWGLSTAGCRPTERAVVVCQLFVLSKRKLLRAIEVFELFTSDKTQTPWIWKRSSSIRPWQRNLSVATLLRKLLHGCHYEFPFVECCGNMNKHKKTNSRSPGNSCLSNYNSDVHNIFPHSSTLG